MKKIDPYNKINQALKNKDSKFLETIKEDLADLRINKKINKNEERLYHYISAICKDLCWDLERIEFTNNNANLETKFIKKAFPT